MVSVPYLVAFSTTPATTKFPIRRLWEVLCGKVRWLPGSGWCDQGFVEILVGPVSAPTIEQIRFAQKERPYVGNYLAVRELLQKGGQLGFGTLLPTEAEQRCAELRRLGFTYSVSKSRVWKPLNFAR